MQKGFMDWYDFPMKEEYHRTYSLPPGSRVQLKVTGPIGGPYLIHIDSEPGSYATVTHTPEGALSISTIREHPPTSTTPDC